MGWAATRISRHLSCNTHFMMFFLAPEALRQRVGTQDLMWVTEVHQDSCCFSQNQERKTSLESRGIAHGLHQVMSLESKDAWVRFGPRVGHQGHKSHSLDFRQCGDSLYSIYWGCMSFPEPQFPYLPNEVLTERLSV